MNKETREALQDAWNYCENEGKSTEFAIEYLQSTANVNYDCVMNFLIKNVFTKQVKPKQR